MSMNDEDKDKWVDDLLAQMPASQPIPRDISEQLDQFLAEHISTLEAQARAQGSNVVSLGAQRSNRLSSRYQFLVAAAAVVGVLTFVGTQTTFFTGNSGSTEVAAEPDSSQSTPMPKENSSEEEKPVIEQGDTGNTNETVPTETSTNNGESSSNQGNGTMVDPEVSSSEIQVLGSEGGTQYLPSNAPNVQITKSGMDYAKNLDAILDEIAPYGEPGKLNKLSDAQLACVIKYKLVDRVVAVDSGKYNGASVVTFFAIADDGTTKAYITKPGNNCELIKRVSIN